MNGHRARGGLRRQWRAAFVVMTAAVMLALAGVTFTYLRTASQYASSSHNLNTSIAESSRLDAAVNDHEGQSHSLWQGSLVDKSAYVRAQNEITAYFATADRDLRGAGEHSLVTHAQQLWRDQLVRRGLWGPDAGRRRGGVTAPMQAAYGAEVNQVYLLFGRLEVTAIRNGNHDLAVADNFKTLGIGLLIGVFALVIGIMGYFARRLTNDVVRPVEMLQAAAGHLRAGSLEHRIDVAGTHHANEVGELADAFNEMAIALHESHHELTRRATYDGLTGLANRSSFIERLNGHFSSDERRLETLNVLFVDIDDFKLVNDTLGHSAGDALLVGVAKRLSACVRPYDYVARLGGDEFAIIALEAPGDRRPADSVAQRILAAFKEPLAIGDRLVSVSVSIGVSTARAGAVDGSGLLSEADFAMYTAKRAGKGRHEFFDPTAEVKPPALVAPVA